MTSHGRIHQNDHFKVDGLSGGKVERLIGYTDTNHDDQPEVIFLKIQGRSPWQRYFLDAGLGFWEEWEEEDTFTGYRGELREIDYGARFGLLGAEILEAGCAVVEPRETTSIAVVFDRGTLRMSYAWPNDLEADVVLTFEPAEG